MGRFSETLMDHFTSPRNEGRLDTPDAVCVAGTPGQGDFLVLSLNVANGRIAAARFQTLGCGATIASGSMLTELIIGRTVEDCQQLTVADLTTALEGVPPDKQHSPMLAISALRQCLESLEASRPPGD